ncbi:MAG: WD40/YVTN/BNR-like repeat-containing protein [Anaerolineae bacterium]|jgi:photosystem II stability/assembly factor-like uncharacterized protein
MSTSVQERVWTNLGPITAGGTVFGLAASAQQGSRFYWAVTGCGVYVSRDGESWQQRLAGLSTPLLSAVTVATNGALFAGALGGGLFASFDYGHTWEQGRVPAEGRATVTVVTASPNFSKDGTVFAGTDGAGLLVSRSSGDVWEDSSFGLDDDTVLALATTPDWSEREVIFAATLNGVYISRNGGRAWRETDLVTDEDPVDVLAVSPAFATDGTIYAGTEGGVLWVSTDGGRQWDVLAEPMGEGPVNCLWLARDFAESGVMLAGVGSALYRSTDRGESWAQAAELPGVILALAGDDEVVLAGLHSAGIYRSSDGGQTWAPSAEGINARGFARLLEYQGRLYAMGPQEGVWVADPAELDWQPLAGLEGYAPVTTLAPLPEGAMLVAGQMQGVLRSQEGGDWTLVLPEPGVQAIGMAPDGLTGWAGTDQGKLFATADGGQSWLEIESPCLSQEILSIAPSPSFDRDHTVYLGSAQGETANLQPRVVLWRSTNGGADWRQVTTQVTDARWIDIAMPRGVTEDVAAQAVLVTGPYCLRPLRRAKDVWISTKVDPSGANTLGLLILGELDGDGVVYAATGNGIYQSIDAGRTWERFAEGLSAESLISIVHAGDNGSGALFALSLGGLVWKYEL